MKRRMRLSVLVCVIGIWVGFPSCTFDNEEDKYGAYCDSSSVTWSGSIVPILEMHCLECHAQAVAANSGGGFEFEQYQSIKSYLDQAKDAYYSSIKHEEVNGVMVNPMPKERPKMSACEIRKMEIWIEAGYLEN